MSIRRVDRGRSHSYIDDEGRRVPGVTTITGTGLPKPALVEWAGNATADYAVDHWDELAELAPSVRLKTLRQARYADRDKAANRGTQIHQLAERLVRGEQVPVPDEIFGHVQSYVRFLDEWDVQPVLVETVVWSPTHGYCGTLDLVADLTDPDSGGTTRWLLDIKTSRSGIFGEVALQLAAYRYAEYYIDEHGDEQPMITVDRCGGVHVRADGYDLIPVEASEIQHRQFLYVQQVALFADTARDLVGEPLTPPTTSRYILTREDDR